MPRGKLQRMAELVPAPFADLVTRLFLEPLAQNTLFELDRRRWYLPDASTPDLSVAFHGRRAGNPAGPAAGPHTQMAQNLLLSYVAGGRILELKTVQVNDRLTISRPCIDMTTVGYNVEWSQELRVEESLREYVAGAMLIEMFRRGRESSSGRLDGPAGDAIFDLSVGYDLAGIRSDKVRGFLDGMRNAGPIIERLRGEVPAAFAAARDLPFATRLSDSITLSTFHGCPADEIERICEFLIGECDFDVIVKMNPPTLGRERLEHLLFDVLGYHELKVNPTAYTSVISFDDSVQLAARLRSFAAARGRRLGFKFSNTLEVLNHRPFFTPDNTVMYLSGQPLHVITLALTDAFRQAVGPDVPISFSAGIDQHNFAAAVACGFVPVTISSDLLRPGGYGRMGGYLQRLAAEMRKCGAETIDTFVLRRFGVEAEARRRAAASGDGSEAAAVRWAGLLNTTLAAQQARDDPRYRAAANGRAPARIDSALETFDCITCDKCLPVCPNAANFTYPTPRVAFDFADLMVDASGAWRPVGSRRFEIEQSMQIACYADFCNECGNCDTFCPEYGGPYIKKPSFFGSVESWQRATPRDGFVVGAAEGERWIRGRIHGRTYDLHVAADGAHRFEDGQTRVDIAPDGLTVRSAAWRSGAHGEHTVDLWPFHVMRYLLTGVLDRGRVNQVNAALVRAEAAP